jgi:N-acylneuraminate cytidylyltransferase
MKNLCVIPARGGSTRIPHKNIKDFMGKPIIAYSIEAARASGLFDRIVVSTDSKMIASVAALYGADVCIRPDALAVNEVGTFEVVRHAARCYLNDDYDNVCCIYATAPMLDKNDLVMSTHLLRGAADHIISVRYPDLCDAAQFYWSRMDAISADIGYFSKDSFTLGYKIEAKRVCDINTMEDWLRAEEMYKALKGIR